MNDPSTGRSRYVVGICARLDQAEYIPFKQVSIGAWEPESGKCHENVDTWVSSNPRCLAVRGWLIYESLGKAVALTAHSVVQEPDGGVYDITPMEDRFRFVRHLEDESTFQAVRRESHEIRCSCPDHRDGR